MTKTIDELQAEVIRLNGELATARGPGSRGDELARAYIAALERAAAAMTAKRVLSDAHINALVDGYPAYDATIEAEQ